MIKRASINIKVPQDDMKYMYNNLAMYGIYIPYIKLVYCPYRLLMKESNILRKKPIALYLCSNRICSLEIPV